MLKGILHLIKARDVKRDFTRRNQTPNQDKIELERLATGD